MSIPVSFTDPSSSTRSAADAQVPISSLLDYGGKAVKLQLASGSQASQASSHSIADDLLEGKGVGDLKGKGKAKANQGSASVKGFIAGTASGLTKLVGEFSHRGRNEATI
jgi:hypothetical protein